MCFSVWKTFSCGHIDLFPIPIFCKDEKHVCPEPWEGLPSHTDACCEASELQRDNAKIEEAWQALRQKYDIKDPNWDDGKDEDEEPVGEQRNPVGPATYENRDRRVERTLNDDQTSGDPPTETARSAAVQGTSNGAWDMEALEFAEHERWILPLLIHGSIAECVTSQTDTLPSCKYQKT